MSDVTKDLAVPLLGGYSGSEISGYSATEAMMKNMAINQRIQSISDMYGKRPASFDEYREKSGQGLKVGKMLLFAAAGAAVAAGGLAGIGVLAGGGILTALGSDALLLSITGAIGAMLGGDYITSKDREKAMKGYESYVSDFATQARQEHDKVISQNIAQSVTVQSQNQPQKNWVATIEQQRSAPSQQNFKG